MSGRQESADPLSDSALEGEFYDFMYVAGHGNREWNRRVLEFYGPYFERCQRVLDVGCGEGQMIEMLSAKGVAAVGVDIDPEMVRGSRVRGLNVEQADLHTYLIEHKGEYDGIFSSNVIEHLSSEQVVRFLDLSFRALRPGGVLLIATPNPESLIVHMYEFWRDATHVRLYNRQLLEFLLRRAGLRNVESHENPITAWTPPDPKLRLDTRWQDSFAAAYAPTRHVGALSWFPGAHQISALTATETVWDPTLLAKPIALWRRPWFWLRRRLARFLARAVMYEEFASIENRLVALRLAVADATKLSAVLTELSATVTELSEHTQASVEDLRGRLLTPELLRAALSELATSLSEPLRRPREAYVVGVKPLADGSTPALPTLPAPQAVEEVALSEGAAAAVPGFDASRIEPEVAPPARVLRQHTGALRVAIFTPYLPYPLDNGGKIRSYHLLRALAERFDVDLYSVHHGAEPAAETLAVMREFCCDVISLAVDKPWRTRERLKRVLAPQPRSVEYFHTAVSLAQARERLQDGRYDVVVTDEICMTPYAELAPHLPRVVARQKVDHLHYAEMARARPWGSDKLLDSLEARKLRRYEHEKMRLYQAFIACSEHDAAIIGRDAPDAQCMVIPNGVDLGAHASTEQLKTGRPILLYVGSMHYYPNVDAVNYFFETMYEQILRARPDVRVQLVGHSPPPEVLQRARLPGVEVMGSVPDVRPFYDAATVFMVPLRLGGGTRLKIVEAMAMGLPVVSTSVGAEGLDIHPGQDVLLADDPAAFVESVTRLLADAELRASLGAGGRRLAARYDWATLMRPFADLVEAVVRQWKTEER